MLGTDLLEMSLDAASQRPENISAANIPILGLGGPISPILHRGSSLEDRVLGKLTETSSQSRTDESFALKDGVDCRQ